MRTRIAQQAEILAHLAGVGLLGPVVLGILFILSTIAVPMIFLFGVGLLIIPLVAFGLRGVAVVETHRVAGLIQAPSTLTPMRRSDRRDGWRIPATIGLQFSDGLNWRATLHLALISLLGWATLALLGMIGTAITLALGPLLTSSFEPRAWWLPVALSPGAAIITGVLAVLIGCGLIIGLIAAHRSISTQMLIPSREQELAAAADAAAQRRQEAMHAAEVERLRIERDLHDGVQPRLVSVGMTLGLAQQKLESDPDSAADLITEAHTSTKAAITELRQLARGIHPAVLSDRGLDAALSALAARSHIPVQLHVELDGRCTPTAEAALYFAVAETLTNVAKHTHATSCQIALRSRPGGAVWARIEDDGPGGARQLPGGGLDGVANRIGAAGGSFSLTSPAGGPTTIEVSVPCAS